MTLTLAVTTIIPKRLNIKRASLLTSGKRFYREKRQVNSAFSKIFLHYYHFVHSRVVDLNHPSIPSRWVLVSKI